MSSIPALLMLGNRFFMALLKEARIALHEDDLQLTFERIQEFRSYMERHRQGEAEVLYQRIATLNPDLEEELEKLSQDYTEIDGLAKIALDNLESRNQYRCDQIVGQLIELTAGHWMTQKNMVYSLVHVADGRLLTELASRLVQSEPRLWGLSKKDGQDKQATPTPDAADTHSPDGQ